MLQHISKKCYCFILTVASLAGCTMVTALLTLPVCMVMLFSVLMGVSRVIYGKFGDKIDLDGMMIFSGALCMASYLLIALSSSAVLGLVGVAMCGFSVGIMWPGTFSKASAGIKGGGTAMFALLALGGDLGCSSGPTFAGMMASAFGDDLKKGILCAIFFPALLTVLTIFTKRRKAKN